MAVTVLPGEVNCWDCCGACSEEAEDGEEGGGLHCRLVWVWTGCGCSSGISKQSRAMSLVVSTCYLLWGRTVSLGCKG